MKLIDAHCHLQEERILQNLKAEISAAQDVGVSAFISSALSKDEFLFIEDKIFQDFQVFWSAGIHPFYEKSDEKDFEEIVRLAERRKIIAIGEIGLDKRADNFSWQSKILLKQLELARDLELPVIFHIVHDYYRLHKILKNNFPQIRGYLHGFNASEEIARTFSQYDLAFSLGSRLPKMAALKFILKRGHLLLETDAPYQKPLNSLEEFNRLSNLKWVLSELSQKMGKKRDEIRQLQFASFQKIFGKII